MTPVDWCIAFNGMNADVLSKVFLDSIGRHCSVDGVKFHFVDNGGVKELVALNTSLLHSVTWYAPQEGWKPSKQPSDYYAESVLSPWDAAEYMMGKCGDHQWCIISHFDMVFKGDMLAWVRNQIANDVGVVGTHCPIMAINRQAYKNRKTGFAPGADYDVGIKLEEDLRSQGWRHVKFNKEAERLVYHLGAGAGYHNKDEYDHMRTRAMAISRGEDKNAYMDQIQPDGRSITLVHFAYRHGAELRIACMPGMREFHQTAYHPNYQMTDAAVATTCPGCKKTAEFVQARGTQR